MTPAIRVENLGKRYRLNHADERLPYKTLRDSLTRLATAPARRWRAGGHDGVAEDFWALREVNFDVQPGDVVGIIGRNGAGKSTLLKVLSRITSPTTGRVAVRGRVGCLLEVGTGFHPELTGRENIYMNGSILGMSRAEIKSKFDEIVEFSGVENFLDTPVKRYSSGMQVRLAFAVAAHLDPEILVVDEVLAVGDAEFQRKCLGKLQNVASGGRTVLFVSHNMAAIESLSGRGILLDGGTITLEGAIGDVIQKYHDSLPIDSVAMYVADERQCAATDARITRAEVSCDGHTSRIGYPAGAEFVFEVECDAGKLQHNLQLGIGINSWEGQRITTLHSSFFNGKHPNAMRGSFGFKCITRSLNLSPGSYHVILSLEDRGETVQRLSPAFTLTILPADAYKNGGKVGRGLILCDQEWSYT